ncbi:MAG TPA: DUF58 domain-containing protein, partial [Planctomycetaceae bacterium]|nr:DUF58 domain-containing protein [Planctomycetaceae bacterium]
PSLYLVFLLLIPAGLAFTVIINPDLVVLVLVIDVVLLGLAGIDGATLPSPQAFGAERKLLGVASLNSPHQVSIIVSNQANRSYQVQVVDDLPQEFHGNPSSFSVSLRELSRTTVEYSFRAQQRGVFELQFVHLRINSSFSLWTRYISLPVPSTVNVYPDMKQTAKYAVLARTNRLSLLGVRRTRRVGQDNEFERLRDYTDDDNYKHIEWRTTARRNKLTVKDFQTNQSQRIIFMLDCGRMMTNEAAGLSLLDHSLNAMLMLSFVALRQGDNVGLICFSDEIHTYVPPKGGMKHINQLLHASFDRFPQLVESRYDEAFRYLGRNCKKRSLVVLISNVIDEVNSHQIHQYLSNLVGQHLPLGVLLRDRSIFEAAENPFLQGSHLYRAAAAADILTWRHQVLTDLEHRGVLSLDVFPEEMTAPLVNRYLDVKARHLL